MIGDRSGTVPPSVTTPSLGSTASLYPELVELPVPLQRLAFRCAFVVLFVYRFIVRPSLHGVKCVLTNSGTVLLVRHTYGPKEWDLPGGGLRRNEAPLTAATREMEEELGVVIEDWLVIGDVLARFQTTRSTMHCFHAELAEPDQVELNRGEILSARWFPYGELPTKVARHVAPILRQAGLR
jgi:8-oxo-dGTP pyrophosphatase MutT (NUDIX family)